MKNLLTAVAVVAALAVLAAPAAADWNQDDGFKMLFPQLPDPDGWDVSWTGTPLADDWLCTLTGPVTDIHFWYSAQDDNGNIPFDLASIGVAIWPDLPDPDGPGPLYSMPDTVGRPLFSRNFGPDKFTTRYWGDGNQGWFDPVEGIVQENDHHNTFQANITDIEEPFYQTEGNIYWLELWVQAYDEQGLQIPVGWKTSYLHFQDDGVYVPPDSGGGEILPDWQELRDPLDPAVSLDMAFVITTIPEPGTLVLAGMGALGFLGFSLRRRMRA